MPEQHALRAEHLAKRYKARWVVKDVSLEVHPGEIVGLLGPNGAGKTTSFYMIVGLTRPSKGAVYFGDQDISRLPMHRRAQMGISYLPQEVSVFRKLTVEQNIMAILEMQDLSKRDRVKKLDELIDAFHLSHIRHNLGMGLSGGERRRTEIARALAISPRYILLDEPFAGVDPISIIDIKRMITQLKEAGIGILITDHNVRDTLDICERAYIVNVGELITAGTPQAILSHDQVKKVYLGDKFKL